MDKLEDRDLPPDLREFLRDILKFERGKLDQDKPHYMSEYENLINKYVDKSDQSTGQ
jgi:hypothetical protein